MIKYYRPNIDNFSVVIYIWILSFIKKKDKNFKIKFKINLKISKKKY